jgi:hypothetical protein
MSVFLDLVDELWTASTPDTRCPHLTHDGQGCLCRSPACPEDGRRLVVDHLSMQLWCLDEERYQLCHFYPAAKKVSL